LNVCEQGKSHDFKSIDLSGGWRTAVISKKNVLALLSRQPEKPRPAPPKVVINTLLGIILLSGKTKQILQRYPSKFLTVMPAKIKGTCLLRAIQSVAGKGSEPKG